MLVIRFSPKGKNRFATFKIVVQEKRRDPQGKTVETLGSYNPHSKEFSIKKERVLFWIQKGAKPSPSVHNILIDKKIIEGKKVKAWIPKKKKKKKTGKAEVKKEKLPKKDKEAGPKEKKVAVPQKSEPKEKKEFPKGKVEKDPEGK